jgi:hypothetical protein
MRNGFLIYSGEKLVGGFSLFLTVLGFVVEARELL